jgi:hypothetical protein
MNSLQLPLTIRVTPLLSVAVTAPKTHVSLPSERLQQEHLLWRYNACICAHGLTPSELSMGDCCTCNVCVDLAGADLGGMQLVVPRGLKNFCDSVELFLQ